MFAKEVIRVELLFEFFTVLKVILFSNNNYCNWTEYNDVVI